MEIPIDVVVWKYCILIINEMLQDLPKNKLISSNLNVQNRNESQQKKINERKLKRRKAECVKL